MIKFGFAEVDRDGDLTFTEEMPHRIKNIIKTEIFLITSKIRAGDRPAMSFHNPHLPLTSREAKMLLACMGIFGSSTAGKCVSSHFQLLTSTTAAEREKIRFEFLTHILYLWQIWLHRGEELACDGWHE